jgi:hypothetical protein
LFVFEMVIEVTRRNPQVRGNVVGGDIALSLIIKEHQTGLNDSISSTHTADNSKKNVAHMNFRDVSSRHAVVTRLNICEPPMAMILRHIQRIYGLYSQYLLTF